ncbi:hypothetical protein HY025_04675 [Candidatus Daviesbacteria bacterium]|nr:hypothetical protein [Candidatus Daviesbacteria bacterium]
MKDLIKTNLTKVEQNPQINSRVDILANSIHQMFPEQEHENNTTLRAKQILRDKYSLEDVKTVIASYEYLINKWLEEYEREIFSGETLKELLAKL